MMPRTVAVFFVLVATVLAADPRPLGFELTFDKAVRSEPFTGRVLIFLCDDNRPGSPRERWVFSADPAFSVDVKEWKPEEALRVRDPRGAPYDLKDLPPAKYKVQAVMHVNTAMPHGGTAPGNIYSNCRRKRLDPIAGGVVKLRLSRVVHPDDRKPTQARARAVEMRSELLSKFHGRDVLMKAVVWPPKEYESDQERLFPAIYVVPGFGGDHFQAIEMAEWLGESGVPFVRIGLDPTLPYGHHVFADSDNNGPCGRALVEEFIPYLERSYRLIADPRGRFVTGHSSGGWSSLWLQVSHPDFFGGTWSTSPDPVDFHDFLGVNLYSERTNLMFDRSGRPRPTMRRGEEVLLTSPDEIRMEDVIGPGGQYGAFDAVFSPRGADGRPAPVCDHKTGVIDRQVVKAWRRYDIRDKVEREWDSVGPLLAGKITVIMGCEDSFYLEGAAGRLKRTLRRLGSDARIIMLPGHDHFSVMHTEQYKAMIEEMSRRFLSSEPGGEGQSRRRPGAQGQAVKLITSPFRRDGTSRLTPAAFDSELVPSATDR
jgi:hypothetical protein